MLGNDSLGNNFSFYDTVQPQQQASKIRLLPGVFCFW